LPLGLEARHHGLRIHTVFEDLERDLSLHRLLLLRDIHRAETALAELLKQPIASDYGSGPVHFYLVGIARKISRIAAQPSRDNSQYCTDVLNQFAMPETFRRNISTTIADNG